MDERDVKMVAPDIDLGDGYSLRWIVEPESGERIAAYVFHPSNHPKHPLGHCLVMVAWKEAGNYHWPVRWDVQGAADDHVTISPSILCLICGDHGFIRNGKWVRA